MTLSLTPALQNCSAQTQPNQNQNFSYCTLKWRRGQLLVRATSAIQQPLLPSVHDKQLLVNCLKHSLINLVSIDPNIGEDRLQLWIAACEEAGKPIFLRLPAGEKQAKQSKPGQKFIDAIAALFLLLLMSPVMLALFLILRLDSTESVFRSEWHVGERGKLFRALKFSTNSHQNITHLGRWMRKYDLDNLPQLWNVLRGEMSLIASRSCTLETAVRLSLAGQQQMNKLSEMTDTWEESNLLHLDSPTL